MNPFSTRRILRTWWPLAASWLLMTAELPLISAIIARLPEAEINLAAWGVVFSVTIIIQSPSTMLLAASTALSRDWNAYQKVRSFMLFIGVTLTSLHIAIAFTPLYDFIAANLLGIPDAIYQPVRIGLMIMVPWSWGTAYRRFQQGVLIRFDHSRTVIWGSVIRVGTDSALLLLGYWIGSVAGIVVGTTAIIAGVLCEDIYTAFRVRPVLQNQLRPAVSSVQILTRGRFLRFYIPLALTVLMTLVVQPMVSAALSRMPDPLVSLAVWPVVWGFLIMWQSVGISYNEAVIALLDHPHAVQKLRQFTILLVLVTTGLLFFVTITPLSTAWFAIVAALTPKLIPLSRQALQLGLLLPGLRILHSWYQGAITYDGNTRGITEAVVVALVTTAAILWLGVVWGQMTGIYVGIIATTAGFFTQVGWLWFRGRVALDKVRLRDTHQAPVTIADNI